LSCLQEKDAAEEEEDDTFDMNINVTDPEKVGMYCMICLGLDVQGKRDLRFRPHSFELCYTWNLLHSKLAAK